MRRTSSALAALLFTAFSTTAHSQPPAETPKTPQIGPTTHTWATIDPLSKKWCRVVYTDGADKDTLVYSHGTLKSGEDFRTAKGDGPDITIQADTIDLGSAQNLYKLACEKKPRQAADERSGNELVAEIF